MVRNSGAVRALVQRVSEASVEVAGDTVAEIAGGLLVLVAAGAGDSAADAVWMAGKVARLRVLPDDDGRMNRSVLDTGGAVLAVSQFTLYGDVSRGNRPGFTGAAPRGRRRRPRRGVRRRPLRAGGAGRAGPVRRTYARRARERRARDDLAGEFLGGGRHGHDRARGGAQKQTRETGDGRVLDLRRPTGGDHDQPAPAPAGHLGHDVGGIDGAPACVSSSAAIPSSRSAATSAWSSQVASPTCTSTTLAPWRRAVSRTIGRARSATAPSRVRITLRIELPR